VEQILASHPQVFGAGELTHFGKAVANLGVGRDGSQAFPELMFSLPEKQFHQLGEWYLAKVKQLAPYAARIVDKMPSNYIYLGLIHLALSASPATPPSLQSNRFVTGARRWDASAIPTCAN
jgi:hypothetical protein